MSKQTGFDFSDALAPGTGAHPAGAWNASNFTTGQYRELFTRAQARLLSIAGPGRAMFRQGLAAAEAEHAKMLACCDRGEHAYSLWRSTPEPSADELAAFVGHCETHQGVPSGFPGIEYKRRHEHGFCSAAMYVEGLGTVMVRQSVAGGAGTDFYLFRHAFF